MREMVFSDQKGSGKFQILKDCLPEKENYLQKYKFIHNYQSHFFMCRKTGKDGQEGKRTKMERKIFKKETERQFKNIFIYLFPINQYST